MGTSLPSSSFPFHDCVSGFTAVSVGHCTASGGVSVARRGGRGLLCGFTAFSGFHAGFHLFSCGKATCKGYASAGKLIAILFLRLCTHSKARSAVFHYFFLGRLKSFQYFYNILSMNRFPGHISTYHTERLKCLGLDLMDIAFSFSSCHVVDILSRFLSQVSHFSSKCSTAEVFYCLLL